MAIPLYLAMTAAELSRCSHPPKRPAWMSCRFSPYGKGLTNLPPTLPTGVLLILDDQNPPDGHDCDLIRQQLLQIITENRCCGLLLDFQRPNDPQLKAVARELLSLPCPVCVSHFYAKELDCPVFLPPCPLSMPIGEYLAPWQGREIWLDAARNSAMITVTESGSRYEALPDTDVCQPSFADDTLHCRYRTECSDACVRFTLSRTREDLHSLLEEAAQLGITRAVGLYQELGM